MHDRKRMRSQANYSLNPLMTISMIPFVSGWKNVRTARNNGVLFDYHIPSENTIAKHKDVFCIGLCSAPPAKIKTVHNELRVYGKPLRLKLATTNKNRGCFFRSFWTAPYSMKWPSETLQKIGHPHYLLFQNHLFRWSMNWRLTYVR